VSEDLLVEDAALHLSRERVPDIRLARVRGAEDVPCIVRRRPLNRRVRVRILRSESGRIVIDLPLLSCPCPADIEAGRRVEWKRPSPEERVYDIEIVRVKDIFQHEVSIALARPHPHRSFRDWQGPEHAVRREMVRSAELIQIARIEIMDLHLRRILRPQTGVFKDVQSEEAKRPMPQAPVSALEHSRHEPHVARPPASHPVRVVFRITYPIGFDETQSTIEIPDHGRVRHRLDRTGKGIYFDRQVGRELDPENAFYYRGKVRELTGKLALALGRKRRPCAQRETRSYGANEQAAGLEEAPARQPLVVTMSGQKMSNAGIRRGRMIRYVVVCFCHLIFSFLYVCHVFGLSSFMSRSSKWDAIENRFLCQKYIKFSKTDTPEFA
jgi:hypothetical protein